MSRRNVSGQKDIRSRIKHSNANLGSGVELSRTPTTSASQAALQSGYATSVGNGVADREAYSQQQQYQGYDTGAYGQGYAPAPPQLGAGPSFVSLTPSDSISQFEGKHGQRGGGGGGAPNHQQHQYASGNSHAAGPAGSLFPRPISPTAGSTASFARQMHHDGMGGGGGGDGYAATANAALPGRPQRSNRRPAGMPPGIETGPSPLGEDAHGYDHHDRRRPRGAAAGPAPPDVSVIPPPPSQGSGAPTGDRHARSARLMAQVNDPRMSVASEDESIEDAYGGLSPIEGPSRSPFSDQPTHGETSSSPHLGSLHKDNNPAALGSVLSALSQAGRKGQGRRIMRGMTAEEESRRRRVERRMDEARNVDFRDLTFYQTPADSEVGGVGRIGAVLRKVKAEWSVLAEDDFNSVALALSLLDESSLGANRSEFESTKHLIEQSLQGTVDDHYESFATAITLHNSVLSSLTSVQSSVSSSRRRLRDSRDALGSKRADLVQLWHRQQSVKEALRLLNTVEQLKGVPDRLESLMSEKHFLTAVNLLVRALKIIEKPEMQEIGAISDLRVWLRSQEGHMLEILVEEIHNHLYLKSIYCERRWKGYEPGEESLPDVKWGKGFDEGDGAATPAADTGSAPDTPSLDSNGRTSSPRPRDAPPMKLAQYLDSLPSRRVPETTYANAQDLGEFAQQTSGTRSPAGGSTAMRREASGTSNHSGVNGGGGGGGDDDAHVAATAAAEFDENPESDSFQYMEMLLEALARLGKMGVAIDIIHQRLPLEIHALVDSTIREVETRSEPLRRTAGLAIIRPESILLASSSALAKTFGGGDGRGSMRASRGSLAAAAKTASHHGSRPLSTLLRLSASESSQVVTDGEIMRDLFWTLFSKLDAVLQGHRVIHEVARQISQRTGFKEHAGTGGVGAGAGAAGAVNGSSTSTFAEKLRGRLVGGERLLEVWGPIQMEVRALLHEHLMDDTQSSSSRRNNMISINEVLRQGRFERDRSKKLFQLGASGGGGGTAAATATTSSTAAKSTTASSGNASRATVVKRHEESLNTVLRAFVPGLVNAADGAGAGAGVLGVASSSGLGERPLAAPPTASLSTDGTTAYTSSMIAGSHRLLVKPDAFNISVLFQPALAFVDRVRVVMPSEAAGETSKGFSAFLDEFVQDVFLPQLEDKVQALFHSAVGGADAFAEDPSSRGVSEKPIVKSAANVVVFIDSLYSMLRTTPFHRESYSRLIIQTIVQYYARCHERFKELVGVVGADGGGGSGGESMLSARWAQDTRLADVLAEMLDGDASSALQDEENLLELNLAAHAGGIGHADLITSRKKLLALGHLQHSLRWFLKHISRLKATDESLPVSSRAKARLSVIGGVEEAAAAAGGAAAAASSSPSEEDGEATLKLPLSRDMAARYETLPRTLRHLSNTLLFTLRMELRARTIHHLDLAVSEGNYLVEESSAEPDPHVVDLNAELANLDDILADSVTAADHRFLFEGLASLMDTMLIASVKKMRAVNRPGVSKMIRNILALQQNLKNIVVSDMGGFASGSGGGSGGAGVPTSPSPSSSVNLESSRRFWELLSLSPSVMLDAVKRETQAGASHRRYGFDEVRCALNLMLGLENGGGGGNVAAGVATPGSKPATAVQTPTSANSVASAASSSLAVGPSLPTLKAGTVDAKEGTVSRQKLNEYLIELHQVLDDGE